MKTPRSNHSLAVVQGRLVAIGGYQGIETTKKVEEGGSLEEEANDEEPFMLR